MREKCGKRQLLWQYQNGYVDLCISNNFLNNFSSAVVLPDFTENMALKRLFEELFQGITLDDVFGDVTSTKSRNAVRRIKTPDTLLLLLTYAHCPMLRSLLEKKRISPTRFDKPSQKRKAG